MAKTKKRRRINIRGVLVILLVVYLIGMFLYYLINLPIKNIVISGTSRLKDVEVIDAAGIKNYPSIMKLNTVKVKKKIKDLELVEDVKVRKSLAGKLTINITENDILFLNRNTNNFVLDNSDEISYNENYIGIPVLINYVPNDIFTKLVDELSKIDNNIISLIGEIEYSPEKFYDEKTEKEIVSNDKRFFLRMNDGNSLYVDTINMKKLDNYLSYYATSDENTKGIFYLDSNREAISFKSYEEVKKESEVKDEDELQQSNEGNNQ